MSVGDAIFGIIAMAILSPMVCFLVHLYWKGSREIKKTMRRNEVIAGIKADWEVQKAITDLIIEKSKNDYLFQQAVISITKKA